MVSCVRLSSRFLFVGGVFRVFFSVFGLKAVTRFTHSILPGIAALESHGRASCGMAIPLLQDHSYRSHTRQTTRNSRRLVRPPSPTPYRSNNSPPPQALTLPLPAPPRIELHARPPPDHPLSTRAHQFLHDAPAEREAADKRELRRDDQVLGCGDGRDEEVLGREEACQLCRFLGGGRGFCGWIS